MKTLILSLVLFLGLMSCQEKETYCFSCTVASSGQVTEFTRCDITQKEADDIARAGTVIDPEYSHPFGARMIKTTICKKSE